MSTKCVSNPAEACKKICVKRCINAIALGIGVQYIMLMAFLIFANISLIHPLVWIRSTFSLLTSFSTYLALVPLSLALAAYGFVLGKMIMSERQYYNTRLSWFLSNLLIKGIFSWVHALVGLITAFLYTSFLNDQFRFLIVRCKNTECINSNFTFLACIGIVAGLSYFFLNYLRQEPEIEVPIIQETCLAQIRPLFIKTLIASFLQAVIRTIVVALGFLFVGNFINGYLAFLFDVYIDYNQTTFISMISSVRLLFYGVLLHAHITANMQILRRIFSIFLTEEYEFVISKSPIINEANHEVPLVDALAMFKFPVIQYLAALDLYNLSIRKTDKRRSDIYALSVPGGHPYNWQQVSGQCLSMMKAFTEELGNSIKTKSSCAQTPANSALPPMPLPAKQLLRQLNQNLGIRPVAECEIQPYPMMYTLQPDCGKPKEAGDHPLSIAFKKFRRFFSAMLMSIPGYSYLCVEQSGGWTNFLLANSEKYGLIAEGLANICSASLVEDTYGVVQLKLPEIIRTLLCLKQELDKLNSVNWNGKRQDRNLTVLRNAVMRSLYKVCADFNCYMNEIIEDRDEMRLLNRFINYQEI